MDAEAVLSQEWHAAFSAELTQMEKRRPFMLLKPRIYPDGNQWCALYGENIQEGVCGFGDTPAKAATDFDIAWLNAKAPKHRRDR